ncbi:hypothetical protein [uncultured Pseudokineococcus sp.]|uniref:hypothetical protein n=1 Tax=uncultured Pseudokineococcus sp. TaxID=1642928 RepID=UPI00261832C8|nr:hypothetical protein [uncultured Pseudokineococcus sp.]
MTTSTHAPHSAMGALLEPEHLAHALRLVFGHNRRRPSRPDLEAAAPALGISTRQLQRWLAGTATPSPASTARLAALLRPSEEVRAREASDVDYARRASAAMALPRGRGIKPKWRLEGWHHKHTVYVLHHPTLGVSRAALVGPGPKALEAALALTPRPPGGHWRILEVKEVKNHFEGIIERARVLGGHDAMRVLLPGSLMRRSNTMCWLADTGECR